VDLLVSGVAFLQLDARAELTSRAECDLHGDFDCACPGQTDSVVYLVAVTGPVDREDGGDVVWRQWVKVWQAWELVHEAEARRRASTSS
jgi:hypothetical protein